MHESKLPTRAGRASTASGTAARPSLLWQGSGDAAALLEHSPCCFPQTEAHCSAATTCRSRSTAALASSRQASRATIHTPHTRLAALPHLQVPRGCGASLVWGCQSWATTPMLSAQSCPSDIPTVLGLTDHHPGASIRIPQPLLLTGNPVSMQQLLLAWLRLPDASRQPAGRPARQVCMPAVEFNCVHLQL
jgi:hypothetical protein